MKILAVCVNGNVRSVTLARLLKRRGHDALACGVDRNSTETISMLCVWADKIFVTDWELRKDIPLNLRYKIDGGVDVGQDVWGRAMHPELVKIMEEKIQKLGL